MAQSKSWLLSYSSKAWSVHHCLAGKRSCRVVKQPTRVKALEMALNPNKWARKNATHSNPFSNSIPNSSKLQNEWVCWIDTMALWTHSVTLTCKRQTSQSKRITNSILEDTAFHVVRIINSKCFGKEAKRGRSVEVAATYGWGVYGDHPHLHFSFAKPKTKTYEEFREIIEAAANKTFWIDRQRYYKPYLDAGWSSYLIEHGTDQLIISLLPNTNSYSS